MMNINKYIKALLHPAGGHQGSHKAHQAGNQSTLHFQFPIDTIIFLSNSKATLIYSKKTERDNYDIR